MAKIVSHKKIFEHRVSGGKSLMRFLTESLSKELLIEEIIPGEEYHGIMGDYVVKFKVKDPSASTWDVSVCHNIFDESGNGEIFYSEVVDSIQRKIFLDFAIPTHAQDKTPSYTMFNILLAFIRLYDPAKLYVRAKYFRPELEQNARLKLTSHGYVVYNNDEGSSCFCNWIISRQHDWLKDKSAWQNNPIVESYNWDNIHLHEADDMMTIADSYKNYNEAQRKAKNPHNVYGYKKLVDSTQAWKETVKQYSGKMGKKRFSEIVRKISEDFNND